MATAAAARRNGGEKGRASLVSQLRSGGQRRCKKSAALGSARFRPAKLVSVPITDQTSAARVSAPSTIHVVLRRTRVGSGGGACAERNGFGSVGSIKCLKRGIAEIGRG